MLNSENELDELLQDDNFIDWVIAPDAQSNDYWYNWEQQDPARKEILQEAKEIVLAIYKNESAASVLPDKELTTSAWEEIHSRILTTEKRISTIKFRRWYKYAIAAAVLGAVAITFFWTRPGSGTAPVQKAQQGLFVNNLNSSEIEFKNNGEKNEVIDLADGSRITLSKNSSLRYARLFNDSKREVYLEGEAFFEVAKDAKRPFYVYSGDVVTKVLGTSFRIISNDKLGKVTVAVKTGKVTVFRNKTEQQKTEYVLVPNQQLVFNDKVNNPVKEIIHDSGLLANEVPAPRHFSFDETSLNTILETLAKTYSVDIIYDKQKNEKCLVTVSLDSESLYGKLELLCKVVGASYHTEDYKIYIDSKGCN
jgi:transmembrane sensor